MVEVKTYGPFPLDLDSGDVLPSARLVYTTYGLLTTSGDNAILFPTAFAGRHGENEWLIGPGRPLDTDRYFVVVPNLLGGGLSSSPSNDEERPGAAFPRLSIADNIRIQSALLEELGVVHLQLVVGYSMGGQQAYEWAVQHPDRVARLAVICSAARTTDWQKVFIDGLRSVLELAIAAESPDEKSAALVALGRSWAGWGVSAEFYDERIYEELGHATYADYVQTAWVERLRRLDPLDVATMLDTWKDHDAGREHSDIEAALGSIRCPTTLITSATDAYFRSDYAATEAALIRRATHIDLASAWGHVAGRGFASRDAEQIEGALRQLLDHP